MAILRLSNPTLARCKSEAVFRENGKNPRQPSAKDQVSVVYGIGDCRSYLGCTACCAPNGSGTRAAGVGDQCSQLPGDLRDTATSAPGGDEPQSGSSGHFRISVE